MRPCFILRKAREDVLKYSDARGALKQAMCTMTVSQEQVRRLHIRWEGKWKGFSVRRRVYRGSVGERHGDMVQMW